MHQNVPSQFFKNFQFLVIKGECRTWSNPYAPKFAIFHQKWSETLPPQHQNTTASCSTEFKLPMGLPLFQSAESGFRISNVQVF